MTTLLLHELFEQQVVQNSKAIAVKFLTKKISYQELDNLSQHLAQHILAQKVKSNQLVAVVMNKGWEQIVAVLGILKAGCAYLPLDPTDSNERLHNLMAIGDTQVILTQKNIQSTLLWPQDKHVIAVDSLEEVATVSQIPHVTQDDLAYVIFTSGSTGTPKGVMITHKNAVNTILDINERFSIHANDKILALSSLNFDLSVYDIFGILAAGGTIVMPTSEQAKDPTQLYNIFFEEKITVWNSVPALMDIFLEYISHKNVGTQDHSLRLILLSGDWIPLNLPVKIRALFNQIRIISLGGATEGSIWSILYEIGVIAPQWKSIPYGKAMKNQAMYILDEKLIPLNHPEIGEIYIGGLGVAQGYWKEEQRTRKQFILHPSFGTIYKTGDLGRYLPDGNIEFLGRADFQVKVSGFRVEINAIEKYLLDYPYIKQAIVLVTYVSNKPQLAAYLNFNYDKFMQENNNYSLYRNKQISYWQKIYEEIGKTAPLSENVTPFNTTGWISSYFNEPIPSIQMHEWVSNTIKRLLFLNPQSVLEIGCGTGLLLFRLAKSVRHYDATDFSEKSLRYVSDQLTSLALDNVELLECEAKNIDQLPQKYDTIILNSVAQYFPTLDYFIEVLDKCINKISHTGYIFIGDLRSLHHLAEFHASVLLHKNTDNYNYNEWKKILEHAIDQEEELIIGHTFFELYKARNPRISYIEILLKEGKYNNEMNCYRYDVILYIDQPLIKTDTEIVNLPWDAELGEYTNLNDIFFQLSTIQPPLLSIQNIPNKRVLGLSYLINNRQVFQEKNWQEIFKHYVSDNMPRHTDPELFYEIAEEYGYYASITWSTENPSENFDVIFEKFHNNYLERKYLMHLESNHTFFKNPSPLKNFSNFPLIPAINKKLITEIKKFLKKNLPNYMIPTYFIHVKEFAMTVNGKIDRNTLPILTSSLMDQKYILPVTPTQKKLVSIWKGLLGINHLGIKNSFHDLGGTSLLFIQLIIEIQAIFNVELSLFEVTNCAFNIENLSTLIENKLNVKVLETYY